ANQGGLYIVENSDEENEKYIKLAACYAYERKKFVEQKIAIGEGMLGQVYLEKETVFMAEVPENYVRITSGLGKAVPRSIIIVPLILNEQVEGLFELASFQVFEPYQLDFLKNLGESVASAVASHRITLNTRRLLEQTQQ
ncbi:MAG: GAF domain-containing protein, partial [Bacteroidota bacterium]